VNAAAGLSLVSPDASLTVRLFGGLSVVDGAGERHVSGLAARLLALLALRRRWLDRRAMARTLWPDQSEAEAASRLRTALWRLRSTVHGLLTANGPAVTLDPAVVVDVEVACEWAGRMIEGSANDQDLDWWSVRHSSFELLPGWDDDWVLMDRERVRHRMLHGIEALSRRLITAGRCPEAVESALVAVAVDPLRESAQRVLIEAHLAESNVIEADRVYQAYRQLLWKEIGLEPGAGITALLVPVRPALQPELFPVRQAG